MMLTQMIAKPTRSHDLAWVNTNYTPEDLEALRLPGLESLNVSEKANLMTHLISHANGWHAFSLEQGDGILEALLRGSSVRNHFIGPFLTNGQFHAGAKTIAWLEEAIGKATDLYFGIVFRILWKHFGTKALPRIASILTNQDKWVVRYYDGELESIRMEAGIGKLAWELLLQPYSDEWVKKSAREFEAIMSRGLTFPAKDWKLLLEHPAHAKVLHGLVLSTEKGEFFALPDWPETAEQLTIAHPSMFKSADELERWRSRFAAEGRRPPFEQLRVSTHVALRLDPVGIAVEPSELFLHLEGLGWTRGRADRVTGLIRTHTKTFPDIGITAEVEYDGVPTRFGGRWSTQTIRAYRFYRESRGFGVAVDEVHPIALSSVMADLAPLQK